MLLLFTDKIIPPPCAQGLDFMPEACVFCDESSDTCHKVTNYYRNFDTFYENNRENNHKDNEQELHSCFLIFDMGNEEI